MLYSKRAKRSICWFACTLLLIAMSALLSACAAGVPLTPAHAYDSAVPTAWFELALRLVEETEGNTPPVASRSFAYMGVALYETVRPGMPGYRSLAGQLKDLTALPPFPSVGEYHWPAAANTALAQMVRYMFPNASEANLAAIDGLEASLLKQFRAEVDEDTLQLSLYWGRVIADTVYTWSKTDGGHGGYLTNFPADYVPPTGPGMWESTPPAYLGALQPNWGYLRPFVLSSGEECPAEPPPAYSVDSGSHFYIEALEVYDTVRNLTEEQNMIARFWADDPGKSATPPGHWISILTQILQQREESLDVAAESYARVGMAVADAFITCWHTKYFYNLIRPIAYLQTHVDPAWNSPIVTDPVVTPPFPEYTSGHSVQSAAAAHVLTSLFGDDVAFVDHTHDAHGLPPRSYGSFLEAAQEAAISRLYGGIHYRAAIENGLAQGVCVGTKIVELQLTE